MKWKPESPEYIFCSAGFAWIFIIKPKYSGHVATLNSVITYITCNKMNFWFIRAFEWSNYLALYESLLIHVIRITKHNVAHEYLRLVASYEYIQSKWKHCAVQCNVCIVACYVLFVRQFIVLHFHSNKSDGFLFFNQ